MRFSGCFFLVFFKQLTALPNQPRWTCPECVLCWLPALWQFKGCRFSPFIWAQFLVVVGTCAKAIFSWGDEGHVSDRCYLTPLLRLIVIWVGCGSIWSLWNSWRSIGTLGMPFSGLCLGRMVACEGYLCGHLWANQVHVCQWQHPPLSKAFASIVAIVSACELKQFNDAAGHFWGLWSGPRCFQMNFFSVVWKVGKQRKQTRNIG